MKSLRTKLIIFVAAALALSAALLSTLAYLSMRQEVLAGVDRQVSEITQQRGEFIAGWLEAKRNAIRGVSESIPMIGSDHWRTQLQQAKTAAGFSYCYMGTPDKAMYQADGSLNPPGYDPTVRPWYRLATEADALVVTRPFMSVSDKALIVSVAAPVKRNGTLIGVVSGNVVLRDIVSSVLAIKLAGDSHAFLVQKDGTVIGHHQPDSATKPVTQVIPDLTSERLQRMSESALPEEVATASGVSYSLSLRAVPGSDWLIGVMVDRNAALQPLNRLVISLAAVTVGVIVFSLGITFVVTRRMLRGLPMLRSAMLGISEGQGDLTVRLPVQSNDEIGEAATAFNRFLEKLQTMFLEVRKGAAQVNEQLRTVSVSASEATRRLVNRSNDLAATSVSMTAVAHKTAHIASSIHEAELDTARVDERARDCAQMVSGVKNEIGHIAENIAGLSRVVHALGGRSDQIAGIVDSIKGIAEQTNLLALNATIEAARAGEQGRGFAVVASEVRKLAEDTSGATVKIGQLIAAIQNEIAVAVDGMTEAKAVVEAGVERANVATRSIGEISSTVADVCKRMAELSAMTSEQADASNELSTHAESVSQEVRRSSDALADADRTLQGTSTLSQQVGELVGRFKL